MTRLRQRVAGLSGWRRAMVALLCGAMATAALPPLHLLPALVVAFPVLVWLIDASGSRRAAFAVGWWFGFGHFIAGIYWFGHAMMTDPERFAWLIAPAIFGISAVLAVFPAAAAASARLMAPGVPRIVGLALAWVIAEWVRGRLFTGFPWNLIAYGWTVSDAMIQIAALAGSYALSFITVLAAAMPATLAEPAAGRRRWLPTALAAGLVAAVWAGGALRLAAASGTDTVDGIRLRLVQPNIAQHHKWQPELREAFFKRHLRLSANDEADGVTHLIWPETAVPFFIADDSLRRRAIATVVPPRGLVITGALRKSPGESVSPDLWNSVHAIDAEGWVVGTYDKFHLVPFGEFVPFRQILTFAKITYGAIDFSAGPGPQTLRLPGLPPVSPLICYEAIFPHQVVNREDRPKWLLNVTNDAWFGMSSGPYQHFASARVRAVEQGLPLVRAANTGISGVVDPYGRVTARLGLGRSGVLDTALPAALGRLTPYARWGDALLLVLVVSVGVGLALGKLMRRKAR